MSEADSAEDRRLERRLKKLKQKRNAGKDDITLRLDKEFETRLKKLKSKVGDVHEEDQQSGVVFVGHIPYGFFEQPMRKFFSQFGRIKRLRMSRNKVTGKCKGYAYIEFEFEEVAKIVSDTMNNHLMFRKLLQCKFVPKDKLHPETFRGCFNRFRKQRRRVQLTQSKHNSLTKADSNRIEHVIQRRRKLYEKKQKRLDELGVNFKIDDSIKQSQSSSKMKSSKMKSS